jgi:hypothetical protein
MLTRVDYDIVFEHPVATPIIAMLYLHPSCRPAIHRDDRHGARYGERRTARSRCGGRRAFDVVRLDPPRAVQRVVQ